ncbi:MAG: response regulator [Proteobacteria bacterium]|nr:response regulator [Pseudomonadota bacterium]
MRWTDTAWLGIALAGLVLVLLLVPFQGPTSLTDLSGRWSAELGGEEVITQIPGAFTEHGDGPARVAIPVQTHQALPQMLYIERVHHAARVLWDGEPIGQLGDPSPGGARVIGSLLVPLPQQADGEVHQLVIEVRGAHGPGAIHGAVVIGETQDVLELSRRHDAFRLGLALTFAILALAQLATLFRRRRTSRLLIGSFAAIAAAHTLSSSGLGGPLSTASVFLRAEGLAQVLLPALVLALSAQFHHPFSKPVRDAILAVSAVLSAFALLAPSAWLGAASPLFELTMALGTLGGAAIAAAAVSAGRSGAAVYLIVGVIPLCIGLTAEALELPTYPGAGLVAFVVGVTIAIQLKETARTARDEQLIRQTPDAILSVDQAGRLLEMNPAGRELLIGPAPAKNLLERIPADDHPAVRAHLARAATRPDHAEFNLTGDPLVAVESFATPVGDGRCVVVLRDITRRRSLDEGLLHAARMETVAVLVGGIAHDFNNMLGTLLAHVGFMREVVENKPLESRLEKMESTIERASLLTRRLLTVSRGSQSELIQVNLEQVARNAVELVQPTLAPGLHLQVDIAEDLSPVMGSSNDLEHVIVNLLVNARDALGTDGQITLVIRDFILESGARGSFLMVEDDGPGVPADLKESIFNPFFTTKGPTSGTGLGLAVASQILRDHHGRIWIEDRPGRGARFCLALRHTDTLDQAPAPLPENRNILLVEDEPVLLESYATALTDAGYTVTACNAGGEAWRVLSRTRPDILVTDVVMPGITGLELATLCDELYEGIPVLLVSGFIPEQSLVGVANAQWTRLDKPVRAARLVSTVGRLCRRAERAGRGELDITQVTWLFPPLDALSAALILDEDPDRTLR